MIFLLSWAAMILCLSSDYKSQVVGQTMKRSFIRAYHSATKTVPLLTHEIVDAFEKEVNEPDRSYILDFYAVSAQRSLAEHN
jgi:hypothetical protein